MSAEEVFRAFISVDLAGLLDLEAVSYTIRGMNLQQKLVEPENVHISLKFLGDTPVRMTEDLLSIMKRSIEGIAPFDISFKGLGAFPKQDNPRVIWIGIQAPASLATIAARLEDGCADLGFRKEGRPFSPHLTLSRVKFVRDRKGLPDLFKVYQAKDFGTVKVEAIRLKKSILGPKGPTYSTVGEVLLTRVST